MHEFFRKFARQSSELAGRAETFLAAVAIIVIWAALGPRYDYSDTWQLVINTATTIITFLMVFMIQNTQNRDARAIQLKLDELPFAPSREPGPGSCGSRSSRTKSSP